MADLARSTIGKYIISPFYWRGSLRTEFYIFLLEVENHTFTLENMDTF